MSDALTAIAGWVLLFGSAGVIAYRRRRAARDAVMERELMGHLAALRRAGEEQARDIATTIIRRRYARLTPQRSSS